MQTAVALHFAAVLFMLCAGLLVSHSQTSSASSLLSDQSPGKSKHGVIADGGWLGSSLTDLASNVFGGPRSSVAKYSSKHRAKAGAQQHWRALGEAHWDVYGNRMAPHQTSALSHVQGLERAGVKISNSLSELDKPTSGGHARKLSGRGEMHLANLANNLLFGERLRRDKRQRETSHLITPNEIDNEKLIGQDSGFFSDRTTAGQTPADHFRSENRNDAMKVQVHEKTDSSHPTHHGMLI